MPSLTGKVLFAGLLLAWMMQCARVEASETAPAASEHSDGDANGPSQGVDLPPPDGSRLSNTLSFEELQRRQARTNSCYEDLKKLKPGELIGLLVDPAPLRKHAISDGELYEAIRQCVLARGVECERMLESLLDDTRPIFTKPIPIQTLGMESRALLDDVRAPREAEAEIRGFKEKVPMIKTDELLSCYVITPPFARLSRKEEFIALGKRRIIREEVVRRGPEAVEMLSAHLDDTRPIYTGGGENLTIGYECRSLLSRIREK